MRVYINDIELDIDVRYQVKYQVSDGLNSSGAYSTEITLPKTANNLRAFGLNDMVITDDTAILNFYTARADENGIDMGIEKAELISFNPFVIRIYGTNSNFFNTIKGKLSDIDWTDLDHTWNSTNIVAANSNVVNYVYPVINYGILDTVTNAIQCSECFPAIYVKSAVNRMTSGYTLDLEFDTDYKYDRMIIPFSNEFPLVMTDAEKATCGFEVYSSGQSVTLLTETEMTFANEVTDAGGNFAANRYTVPFDFYGSFKFEVSARSAVALTTTDITFALYKDDGSPTLLGTATYNFPATYTDKTIVEFQGYFELYSGDEIYITATPLNQNCAFQGGVDAQGDGYTRWFLLDIKDIMIIGFTWRVGLNLPDITQAALFEYVLQSFGAIVQVDERIKKIYATKLDTIANSEGEDWTDKVDLSKPIKRTFDLPDVGQVSSFKYLDDDNVTKPSGTDYEFAVASDKLPAEKNIYTAPFAACVTENKFLMGLNVVNVEVDGESACKPRILINRLRRLSTPLNYQVNYVTVDSDSTVFVPYFAELSKPYDLTWQKLATNNLGTKISMIRNPRGLELYIRISPTDINQLNFRTRKWIGTLGEEVINAWFYLSELNYDTHESSFVKLKLL